MNKGLRKLLGVAGGLLLLFLATTQFIRSYQAGEPRWYYLVMISGMLLLLYYTFFRQANKPPKQS